MVTKNITYVGGIDESFDFVFDLDLVIRYLIKHPNVNYERRSISAFGLHSGSKTCSAEERFHAERLTLYRKLLLNPLYKRVHKHCRKRLRSYAWWYRLSTILDFEGPRGARAVQIISAMCRDPAVRFSRLSLGAVRRVLFSSAWPGPIR